MDKCAIKRPGQPDLYNDESLACMEAEWRAQGTGKTKVPTKPLRSPGTGIKVRDTDKAFKDRVHAIELKVAEARKAAANYRANSDRCFSDYGELIAEHEKLLSRQEWWEFWLEMSGKVVKYISLAAGIRSAAQQLATANAKLVQQTGAQWRSVVGTGPQRNIKLATLLGQWRADKMDNQFLSGFDLAVPGLKFVLGSVIPVEGAPRDVAASVLSIAWNLTIGCDPNKVAKEGIRLLTGEDMGEVKKNHRKAIEEMREAQINWSSHYLAKALALESEADFIEKRLGWLGSGLWTLEEIEKSLR